MIASQHQMIEQLMQELLLRVPHAGKLLEIKGIGMVTAAVIVSEIGDSRRAKRSPKEAQKNGNHRSHGSWSVCCYRVRGAR